MQRVQFSKAPVSRDFLKKIGREDANANGISDCRLALLGKTQIYFCLFYHHLILIFGGLRLLVGKGEGSTATNPGPRFLDLFRGQP